MKTINIPNFAKRLFAAILDALFFAFIFFLLYAFALDPIVNSMMGKTANIVLGYQYQTASHLYVLCQVVDSGSGETIAIEVKDYSEKISNTQEQAITAIVLRSEKDSSYLLSHMKYYYCSYKTGLNIELPNDTASKHYDMVTDNFVAPNYNDEIEVEGVKKLPKDIYTEDWFNSTILEIGSKNAIYQLDGASEYVLTDSFKNKHTDASKTEEENKANIEKEARIYVANKIYDATKDLYEQPFMKMVNSNVNGARVVQIIVSYYISFALVYILFPLIFRNGETLGKKTMHICLVNKKDYQVTKPQMLLRSLVLMAEFSLCSFIIGVGPTSLATLGVGLFVLLIATLLIKNNKAPHDLAAGTLVIDAKTSVFFENASEEERAVNKLQENMDKYKSNKVENKNIIQVGSKIIDESIKKELEESEEKESASQKK